MDHQSYIRFPDANLFSSQVAHGLCEVPSMKVLTRGRMKEQWWGSFHDLSPLLAFYSLLRWPQTPCQTLSHMACERSNTLALHGVQSGVKLLPALWGCANGKSLTKAAGKRCCQDCPLALHSLILRDCGVSNLNLWCSTCIQSYLDCRH